ncbi:MAG: PorP/SprF family type IX secretion system membrane protein [Bacteroidales bacterium]|nr:MAG: PorP/SprF family type IX secretion system membrane protein [Bacteroidales bacterium]
MKKHVFIIIGFLVVVRTGFSQDPQFSQFYANPLYLAPSFAGATEENRLAFNHRNQWPALPGVFHTYSFSFDHYFANFNSGVGFLAFHDRAGSGRLNTTNLGLQYSYDIQVTNELHVRPGIHFLYTRIGLRFADLTFNDQLSPGGTPTPTIELPPEGPFGDVDASFSVLAYVPKIWLGFSIDHLLRPEQSLYGESTKIPMKIAVFGGAQVIRRGRLLKPIEESLSLAFMFKTQADFYQLDLGLYWYKNPLVLGFWYRGIPFVQEQIGDAVVLLAGFKNQQFHIGYSYDVTISNLITDTGGAHEISLVYEFRLNEKRKKKIHAIPCPEF